MTPNVGIISIGVFLPDQVRRNDWWSPGVVASWSAHLEPPAVSGSETSELERTLRRALHEQQRDPFRGVVERRIMPASMTSYDMEAHAARDALARAGIDPRQIGLVLTHTVCPEYLLSNSAAVLHERLGLAPECIALQTEAAAYSFLGQLAIAEAHILARRCRYALLVQSSGASRLVEPTDVMSGHFGDGASAVIVGPVSTRGMISSVHFVDGRYPKTIVAGVPGRAWYEGRSIIHVADAQGLRRVLLSTVELCKTSVDVVLDRSRLRPNEVDFFAIHQGTSWLRSIAQDHCGLQQAGSVETFAVTGYLFSAIIPFGLRVAQDRGALKSGDNVLLFGGGTGMTYGSVLMEWGH